jgi:hypothetical protein
MREIAEDLDQAKAFAHEHHILTVSSEPAEIGPMGATPIGQAPIAFALIVRKDRVDFIETPIRYLGGFDDTARFSTSVEHDPTLAGRRGVRLVFRATRSGLDAFDYKFKQLVGEFGTVAEGERPEVLIRFGDQLAHGLPNLQRTTTFAAMAASSLTGPVWRLQLLHWGNVATLRHVNGGLRCANPPYGLSGLRLLYRLGFLW